MPQLILHRQIPMAKPPEVSGPTPIVVNPIDVQVLGGGYALEQRLACTEALDPIIDEFGLDLVISRLRLVAALNGREL